MLAEKSFHQVFWDVCIQEFPDHIDLLQEAAGDFQLNESSLSDPRVMERFCRDLLIQTKAPWPRYARFLAHHSLLHLLTPLLKGEPCPDVSEYFKPGFLLAHRTTMSFYGQRRISQFTENTDDRPYWMLTKDDVCPGCLHDPTEPMLWSSDYWQRKQIPCECLGCRSSIRAFNRRDMIRRGYEHRIE